MVEMAFTYVQRYQVVQYTNVASVTFFVYDCLITFSDEIEFVWRSPWNLGKALFFTNRYLVFIDSSLMLVYLFDSDLGDKLCERLFGASSYLMGIGIIISGVIMSIRVYALWERSRRVLAVLVLSILTALIIFIAVYTKARSEISWLELSIGTFTHCVGYGVIRSNPLPGVFAVLMYLGCVIALLTAWKGILQWCHSTYHSPLMAIFYRDGLLYFVCLFAFSAANFVNSQWEFGYGNYYDLLIVMQRCFHSVVSARIILNMKEVSKAGRNETTLDAISFATPTISEVHTFELAAGSRGETSSRSVYQDVHEDTESLSEAGLGQVRGQSSNGFNPCVGHRV